MTVRCLIFLLLFPSFSFGQQQFYGTRVTSLSLSGPSTESDLQLLPIHVGDVITNDNVRASIQALHDTGRYSYIAVDATPEASGTKLTFIVRPVYFFSTFLLEPDDLINRPISGFLRLPYGERFSQNVADRIASDTADLLHSEGYFNAVVKATAQLDETTRLASVVLNATGQRATVGSVTITGAEEIIPKRSELFDALDLKTGNEFSADKLDS